jgi:hypothetical protein
MEGQKVDVLNLNQLHALPAPGKRLFTGAITQYFAYDLKRLYRERSIIESSLFYSN